MRHWVSAAARQTPGLRNFALGGAEPRRLCSRAAVGMMPLTHCLGFRVGGHTLSQHYDIICYYTDMVHVGANKFGINVHTRYLLKFHLLLPFATCVWACGPTSCL